MNGANGFSSRRISRAFGAGVLLCLKLLPFGSTAVANNSSLRGTGVAETAVSLKRLIERSVKREFPLLHHRAPEAFPRLTFWGELVHRAQNRHLPLTPSEYRALLRWHRESFESWGRLAFESADNQITGGYGVRPEVADVRRARRSLKHKRDFLRVARSARGALQADEVSIPEFVPPPRARPSGLAGALALIEGPRHSEPEVAALLWADFASLGAEPGGAEAQRLLTLLVDKPLSIDDLVRRSGREGAAVRADVERLIEQCLVLETGNSTQLRLSESLERFIRAVDQATPTQVRPGRMREFNLAAATLGRAFGQGELELLPPEVERLVADRYPMTVRATSARILAAYISLTDPDRRALEALVNAAPLRATRSVEVVETNLRDKLLRWGLAQPGYAPEAERVYIPSDVRAFLRGLAQTRPPRSVP